MTTTDDFEFDELDELAAAYLDGEATPAEIARVEADPEIQARVDEFRGAAEAVAVPVAPTSLETRDNAVAAALTAFTEANRSARIPGLSDPTQSVALVPVRKEPTVSSLDNHRRSIITHDRAMSILKVAAGIMVAVIGLGAIIQLSRSTDSEVATSVAETVTDAAADTADAASDSVAGNASSGDDSDDAMEEDAAMEDDAMEEDAMEEPEVAPEGDTDAEAAMAEEPAAEEDAVPEATAGQEPATDSSTTATDDDGEAEAAKDDSADDTNDAADGDVDAEADLVPDNGALRYALPDPAIADRDDYLGTFNSYGQFFTSYGQASEGVSPQFVIPREFNACDLTTLLPPPRAALYMGTATIADDQVLVGLEPGRSDDANSPNVDQLLIIDQNEIDECIVSVRSPRQE